MATSSISLQAQLEDAPPERSLGLEFLEESRYTSIPLATSPLFGSLPSKVMLSEQFPRPGDQGRQGSCVGWAVGYALKSFQEREEREWKLAVPEHTFSPSYIYNQIKPSGDCDTGSNFIDALNLVRKHGSVSIVDFPYDETECSERPTARLKEAGREFGIAEWRRVNVQDEVETKTQLAARYPVLLGMQVDQRFMQLSGAEPYDRYIGPSLGGHAIVIVGYDDSIECFRLLNSWGEDWGDHGLCWISYSALRQVAKEGYVARDMVVPDADDDVVIEDDDEPVEPESPVATLRLPTVIHNVMCVSPIGQVPGMLVQFAGAVDHAAGRQCQVVVRYFLFDGSPVMANYQEFTYRDIYGQVATGTPQFTLDSDSYSLDRMSVNLPYYALNHQSSGGRFTYTLSLRVDLFLDDFVAAQSPAVPFTLTW